MVENWTDSSRLKWGKFQDFFLHCFECKFHPMILCPQNSPRKPIFPKIWKETYHRLPQQRRQIHPSVGSQMDLILAGFEKNWCNAKRKIATNFQNFGGTRTRAYRTQILQLGGFNMRKCVWTVGGFLLINLINPISKQACSNLLQGRFSSSKS